MLTLKEDAIRKAMEKKIPFEEIARVAGAIEGEKEDEEEAEEAPKATDATAAEGQEKRSIAAGDLDLV
jgi:hypothetical protein